MTDQDPTQRYDPPTAGSQPPFTPPAPDDAAVDAPPAAAAADAPPPAPVRFAPPDAADPTAVPTAPVATSTAPRGKRGTLRWLVAGLVVLLVAGAAAAGTMLLTSDSGDPAVLTYAPADSTFYTELRLDLPGSQAQELPEVMSAFPGFDDQAAFPVKLDEVLDRLVSSATDGAQTWTGDVDPWFGRQLSVSAGPLPDSLEDAAATGRGLLLASVTDAAKAEAWLTRLAANEGATTTTETYNGVTITLVTPKDQAMADVPAWAITGPVLAMGDVASVKAAIDTNGTTGLNTDEQFQTASASVSGDRLAFTYVDVEALVDGAQALAGAAAQPMPSLPAALTDLTVPWFVSTLRAEDGAFVVESRNPHLEALGEPKSSDSTLASVLPPTTVLLAEGHDVNEALTRAKDQLAAQPELADEVKEVEDALKLVGGWDAVVGWMGEVGVAMTRDGEDISGGLVVAPTNAEDPQRLLDQLQGFLTLAGGGSGITVTTEDYNGTPITIVNLGDLGALAGAATDGALDAPADLTISYAVTPEVVVIGYGTDFTKAVLDARGGESLADTARFAAALEQAGTTHSALVWLDVAGLRGVAESMLPADQKAEYEKDAKPYLDAFDSVIGTFAPAADLDRGTVIIRVTGE
jgi:hypothetical protein